MEKTLGITNIFKLRRKWLIIVTLIVVLWVGLLSSLILIGVWKVRVERKVRIGIIEIKGYLIYEFDKELYLRMIDFAIRNDTIDAVIVRIDSPGGYAVYVEAIYGGLRLLAIKKPVVAVIEGIGASGGYFVSLAAEYIISEPTAFVGGVGVIVIAPKRVIVPEEILETGPYKFTGFPRINFSLTVKDALNNFVNIVKERRGNKLKISLEELCKGGLYLGSESKELGLVDATGSFWDALKYLVSKMKAEKYELISLRKLVIKPNATLLGYELWNKVKRLSLNDLLNAIVNPIQIHYLYPMFIKQLSEQMIVFVPKPPVRPPSTIDLGVRDSILIDLAHNNVFDLNDIENLIGEFLKRGIYVRFVSTSYEMERALSEKPLALLIINPSQSFTVSEIRSIKEYVKMGGKLILIYDPSRTDPTYINLVAMEFGIYFSSGYLYDMQKHYGIYRNIIIEKFDYSSILVKGVEKLVLFTATHVYSSIGGNIAFTSNTTYLSTTEVRGIYTPIVVKNNVVAIGDLTFLTEPYCQIADNLRFIKNLVQFVKEKT